MSRAVYKYPLRAVDNQAVDLPIGATLLAVQEQYGQPCLWALVDTDAGHLPRRIRIHGTGHPIENADALKYIATFQLSGGALVFHAFEDLS